MRNYGACMHAAPLDARDDTGVDGGPDGHGDGGIFARPLNRR